MEALLWANLPTVHQQSLSNIPSSRPATYAYVRLPLTLSGGNASPRLFHQSNLISGLAYLQVLQ